MDENSNTSSIDLPARDRVALFLILALYLARGLEILTFETAAMNVLLIIGLYDILIKINFNFN